MGIKKIARPMNNAKNEFLQWLKDRDAEGVGEFIGEKEADGGWDYYRSITGFVGECFYLVFFTIWNGKISIEASTNNGHEHKFDNVDDFLKLMRR